MRKILITSLSVFELVLLGSGIFFLRPVEVEAHRSGCHSAHSCPSDTGSYTCGDTGNCSQCGDNLYCKGGVPGNYAAPTPPPTPPPAQTPAPVVTPAAAQPVAPQKPTMEGADTTLATDDTTPTFNGTAEKDAKIVMQIDGTDFTDAAVSGDGKWSITIPEDKKLSDGKYKVSVYATRDELKSGSVGLEMTINTKSEEPATSQNETTNAVPNQVDSSGGVSDVVIGIVVLIMGSLAGYGIWKWFKKLPAA